MSKLVQSSKEQGQQGTSVLSDVAQRPAQSLQTQQDVSVIQQSFGLPETLSNSVITSFAAASIASGGSGHHVRAIDPNHCYKMDHKKRGKCIIFNNKEFSKSTTMPARHGSDFDALSVREIFRDLLQFDVDMHDNRTTIEMLQIVAKAAAEESNHDSDCLALVILSHGGEGGVVYGTNGIIKLEVLIEPLKGLGCPALIGKPKLIFIQACRGVQLDEGVNASDTKRNKTAATLDDAAYKIPTEADFLYAFSCPPGYYSFRNAKQGSWFIQAIAKVFKKHGTKLEIMQLLTRVNQTVALEFESNSQNKEYTGKKQIPTIVSLLTKELYFTRNR